MKTLHTIGVTLFTIAVGSALMTIVSSVLMLIIGGILLILMMLLAFGLGSITVQSIRGLLTRS